MEIEDVHNDWHDIICDVEAEVGDGDEEEIERQASSVFLRIYGQTFEQKINAIEHRLLDL